jgi:hypothetical protein
MDKRLIFLIVGVLLIASVILVLKKCTNSDRVSKASITISPREIKEGDSIIYKDETKGAVRWKWDFGDGETSINNSGAHHYLSAGMYTITEEVYGSFGKIVDTSAHIIVSSRLSDVIPAASFSIDGPATAIVGERVTYVCNTPNVARYLWRSDETGHTDTTKKFIYTFTSPGTIGINLHVVMADNSEGNKHMDIVVKNKPLPAGAKPPAPKPTGEIEADLKKTFLQITDVNYNGDMPPEYQAMIHKYFCDNPSVNVIVNSGSPIDINSYCGKLIVKKGTNILNVKVGLTADGCIGNVAVTQK